MYDGDDLAMPLFYISDEIITEIISKPAASYPPVQIPRR